MDRQELKERSQLKHLGSVLDYMDHIFREVTVVEKEIKQQILKAIKQERLLAITDCHTQCLTGGIAKILEFLFSTFGHVLVSMLENKENELRTLNYHPHHPIDIIFNGNLVEYATMAYQLFSHQQTITKAYSVFNHTRLFNCAIVTKWNHLNDCAKNLN